MSFELFLISFLFLKHFICDFPLQATPWMYKNKGTYFHPGGIAHAFVHSCGTGIAVVMALIFYGYPPEKAKDLAMYAAVIDGILHYHIDWSKMNIGKYFT